MSEGPPHCLGFTWRPSPDVHLTTVRELGRLSLTALPSKGSSVGACYRLKQQRAAGAMII